MNNSEREIWRAAPIAEFLPHDPPMLLLKRIRDYGENHLLAEVHIDQHSLFADGDGSVPVWIGIEYMAQAVAAFAGVRARLAGEPVPLGYLLGTRRYRSSLIAFQPGQRLLVRVEQLLEDEGMGMYECRIDVDGDWVEARLSVYRENNHERND